MFPGAVHTGRQLNTDVNALPLSSGQYRPNRITDPGVLDMGERQTGDDGVDMMGDFLLGP